MYYQSIFWSPWDLLPLYHRNLNSSHLSIAKSFGT